jgi:nucleotide-binding universal stress UspA family protein
MHSDVTGQQLRPVVVGVDGSRTGPGTIDLAATEAARRGVPMLIVHVWPGRYTSTLRQRGAGTSRADGQRLLELSANRARLAAPGLPIRTEMLDGAAANLLARCSEQADLLVLGHRDAVASRPSWGSTTAYLAHHSACPVLVYRGAALRQGPVVVAVSARPSGWSTVGYAFAEAALLDSRLVAVHMWTRPEDEPSPLVVASGYATERAAAEQNLADVLVDWSARFPGVPVDRLVVRDLELGYTIDRASRRGRLLVAGIGQQGRFAELLYGSQRRGNPNQAICPVVLVPGGWPVAKRGSLAGAGRPNAAGCGDR